LIVSALLTAETIFFSFFFQNFTTKEIFGCKTGRRTKDEKNQRTVRLFDFNAVDWLSPLYAGMRIMMRPCLACEPVYRGNYA